MSRELPIWVNEMSEEEWKELGEKSNAYTNCAICNRRLILTLCRHEELKYFCAEHCPVHKWQTDFDWQWECARCGLSYINYLEDLLITHKIPFKRNTEKRQKK